MLMSESWSKIDEYNNDRPKRVSDLVEVYDKKDYENVWKSVRFLGPIWSNCSHTVKTQGREGKQNFFYVDCLNYNRETGQIEENGCPYCRVGVPTTIRYYQNAIIRELEEKQPVDKGDRTDFEKQVKELGGRKFFIKENKSTTSWTPVRIIQLSKSIVGKLKTIESLNYYKNEEGERVTAPLSDLQYGVDLFIKYVPNATKPVDKYEVQRDSDSGKTPITKDMRKEYLLWDLELPTPDRQKTFADFKRNVPKLVNASRDVELQKIKEELQVTEDKPAKQPKPIKTVDLDEEDDLDNDVTPVQQALTEDVHLESNSKSSLDDMDEFEDL